MTPRRPAQSLAGVGRRQVGALVANPFGAGAAVILSNAALGLTPVERARLPATCDRGAINAMEVLLRQAGYG